MPSVNKLIHGLTILALLLGSGCDRDAGESKQQPAVSPRKNIAAAAAMDLTYIGRQTCAECHSKEAALYAGSHHDLAMQEADTRTVLGDFNHAAYAYNGTTSVFFQREGKFFVNTDGADGRPADFEIKYTFGVTPLQQYLIEFAGGRLQALGIAWDSRARTAGGQRWMHLYPDDNIRHNDPLHWTGKNQNWNTMCSECHSTNLEKNFDADSNTYQTRWAEIDVSCEACHGPGSRHVALAREPPAAGLNSITSTGLVVDFTSARRGEWRLRDNAATAALDVPRTSDTLIDVCSSCHSRRTALVGNPLAGQPLADTHAVALLEPGMFHSDGQADGEVYIHGSFVQSKMYAAGVNCSDCHDSHSARLRYTGNALCGQCHRDTVYDTPRHHFHSAGSEAAQCVSCHMPAKYFMVIDRRHDHSIRIPRPDLSIKTGVPNACNQCHRDRTPQWSAAALQRRYGKEQSGFHYALAFAAARNNGPDAEALLQRVVTDTTLPAIVRATAVSQLGAYLDATTKPLLIANLRAPDAVIRSAALQALAGMSPAERLPLMQGLLADPARSVRIQAARLLASYEDSSLPAQLQSRLSVTLQEYVEAQRINSDRAYAHVNLGNLYVEMRRHEQAESAYRLALRVEPDFLPAYINLAELQRLRGLETQGIAVLRLAIAAQPDAALAHHALGLALVRQGQHSDAARELEIAMHLEPDNLHYQLVYAIALNSQGESGRAIAILTAAYRSHPGDRDLLLTLATLHRDHGDGNSAIAYAEQLLRISPADDPLAAQLRAELRKRFGK